MEATKPSLLAEATDCSDAAHTIAMLASRDAGLGPRWMFWRRKRDILALLAFLGLFNISGMRANLSVAIVAMTSPRNLTLANYTVVQVRDFSWDSKTQGVVHSAFFYGYMTSQLPGGWLAGKVGGRAMFGLAVGSAAALSVLIPSVVRADARLLMVTRALEGLAAGVSHPSLDALWPMWAPPLERSRLVSFAAAGYGTGMVAALLPSGYIAVRLGWPSVFYVSGTLGMLWFVAWWTLVKDNPAACVTISPEELAYITASLGHDGGAPKIAGYPWRSIVTSLPVWAGVCAIFVGSWNYYTLAAQLPTYMKDVLKFDLGKAGALAAVPYVAVAVVLPLAGRAADWLLASTVLRVTQVRKLLVCGPLCVSATLLIVSGYLKDATAIMCCLTAAICMDAINWSMATVNHLDLAPRYASLLTGFSQTVYGLGGVVSPTITGYIVHDGTAEEWRTVFILAGCVALLGAVVYLLLGSGRLQPWASPPQHQGCQLSAAPLAQHQDTNC